MSFVVAARRRSKPGAFAAEGAIPEDDDPEIIPADEGMSMLNPVEMEYMSGW